MPGFIEIVQDLRDIKYPEIATMHAVVVEKEALMNPHYAAIDGVYANAVNVTKVANNELNINIVATDLALGVASKTSIVAGAIANVNTVAIDLALGAASKTSIVSGAIAHVTTVSTDLALGVSSNVKIVSGAIANVNATGTDLALGAASKISIVAGATANMTTVATDLALGAASGIKIAALNITAIQNASSNASVAAAAAATATAKANEIKGITVGSVSTGIAGSSATVSYNPADGKFYFTIPQGAKGDKGDSFSVNSIGLLAQRSLYDAQVSGFSFLALDEAKIYFKLSSASGNWSLGSPFGKGDKGDPGEQGYSWLHGAGVPDNAVGRDNDFYMNMANADVYIRVAGTWTLFLNLAVPIDDTNVGNLITWSSTKISYELSLKADAQATADALAAKIGANLTVALNTAKATVASHATTSQIWTALGNIIDFTGTSTVTAFPNAPQAGAERTLICAGACSFTAGANLLINGVTSGTTITCAAGDQVTVTALSTTQFRLNIITVVSTALTLAQVQAIALSIRF